MDSPFLRQILVASAPQLAAFSVGGVGGFSNVILEQLKANDSSIQIDFGIATWIGSVHGLAGIPSIAMPTIMQWKGRKIAFIFSCLILLTGWMMTYLSQNVTTIIIGECFHGLGINCIIIASLSAISEMVDPSYRAISSSFYIINQTLGITICGIIGRYLHWKTVSIVMSIPIILALIISLVWPESPSWLAYKGEYAKCEESFKWLRGSDENSMMELKELLTAQKERAIARRNAKYKLNDLWTQITSKDFYVPCFQGFIVVCPFYLCGYLIIVVYGVDVMKSVSNSTSAARYGMIAAHIASYIGALSTALRLKLYKNKTVFITSGLGSAASMFCAAIVICLQTFGILHRYTTISLYFLAIFMFSFSSGVSSLTFSVPNELMPVKHRGLGGAIYIIQICVLHSSVLKLYPYLMLYMDWWGMFLLGSGLEILCILYIWKYVPETKGRTLQQIENYYNYGSFLRGNNEDIETMNSGSMNNN